MIWSSWKRLKISTSEAVKRFQDTLNIKLSIFWVRADEVFYNFMNFDIICPKSSTTHCKNFIEKAQMRFFFFIYVLKEMHYKLIVVSDLSCMKWVECLYMYVQNKKINWEIRSFENLKGTTDSCPNIFFLKTY